MYAVEFEADIRDGTVKIPDIYRPLDNTRARIVLMISDKGAGPQCETELDFSNLEIEAFSGRDALDIQRIMRDEW